MLTMATLQRLWKASPPLTATGLLMLAVFAASLAAMAVDTSTILGAPRWLKPAKFAISTAIYAFTLAWIFTYLPDRPRLTRRVGWITAVVVILEVAIIDLQAARGRHPDRRAVPASLRRRVVRLGAAARHAADRHRAGDRRPNDHADPGPA